MTRQRVSHHIGHNVRQMLDQVCVQGSVLPVGLVSLLWLVPASHHHSSIVSIRILNMKALLNLVVNP